MPERDHSSVGHYQGTSAMIPRITLRRVKSPTHAEQFHFLERLVARAHMACRVVNCMMVHAFIILVLIPGSSMECRPQMLFQILGSRSSSWCRISTGRTGYAINSQETSMGPAYSPGGYIGTIPEAPPGVSS